jgi:hypothetical protein
MRKLFIGLTAVAGIALASPALAEGFYFGGPGVGVGVDVGPRYYRDYDAPRYRAYDYDRPRYRGSYAYGGCRTITIERSDGSVRRVRRCG